MPKTHADPDMNTRREKIIELARTIEQRADETLPLASLAKEVGLSPSRLQKLFKETFGLSRKYLIPLLEYMDRTGVTRRTEEGRTLTGGNGR